MGCKMLVGFSWKCIAFLFACIQERRLPWRQFGYVLAPDPYDSQEIPHVAEPVSRQLSPTASKTARVFPRTIPWLISGSISTSRLPRIGRSVPSAMQQIISPPIIRRSSATILRSKLLIITPICWLAAAKAECHNASLSVSLLWTVRRHPDHPEDYVSGT
jgi:hypothetical protein